MQAEILAIKRFFAHDFLSQHYLDFCCPNQETLLGLFISDTAQCWCLAHLPAAPPWVTFSSLSCSLVKGTTAVTPTLCRAPQPKRLPLPSSPGQGTSILQHCPAWVASGNGTPGSAQRLCFREEGQTLICITPEPAVGIWGCSFLQLQLHWAFGHGGRSWWHFKGRLKDGKGTFSCSSATGEQPPVKHYLWSCQVFNACCKI